MKLFSPFRIVIVSIVILLIFSPAILIHADSTTIQPAAGSINLNPATTNPAQYIINIYEFALIAAGAIAFLMVLYAGIQYLTSAGNPSKAKEATGKLTDTALGILLLFGAYIILRTINPNLINLTLPGLAGVNTAAPVAPAPTTPSGGTGSKGGSCTTLPSGNPCSVAAMQTACPGWNATEASQICNLESSGGNPNIPSGSDICTTNGVQNGVKVSWGLMQINLTTTKSSLLSVNGVSCMQAFNGQYTHGGSACSINNQTLYNQCVALAQNPQINLQVACQLWKSQGGFVGPWKTTVNKCGLSN